MLGIKILIIVGHFNLHPASFRISHTLIQQTRFKNLLYLNCDFLLIRQGLENPLLVTKLIQHFNLDHPIVMIDEVQRIENPGLMIKAILDLQLPIKIIVTGSSQLEMKSKIQEHLTGRQLEALILPLSINELNDQYFNEHAVLYGCYPQVIRSQQKIILLAQIYRDYINKDIIQVARVKKPDLMEKLISLIAHSTGQLMNYQQLATDCKANVPIIHDYLSILEQTYVITKVTPYVGNKRTELTTNPIYYFIDNGFRNQALNNFNPLQNRTDNGLLIQSAVFQELFKFKYQHFLQYSIFYWRTKGGAKVDFVVYNNEDQLIPIEVKYRNLTASRIERGFRSFLSAYSPKIAIIITKNWKDMVTIDNTKVYFIPFTDLHEVFGLIGSQT